MAGSASPGSAPEAGAVRSARALLGVTADAEARELTRAYWRRARHLHPDLSADPEATRQFQGLSAAYRLALAAAVRAAPPAIDTPAVDVGAATSGPADGVWLVAGPVRVTPTSRSETSRRTEGRP